jgi:hypothetical protein
MWAISPGSLTLRFLPSMMSVASHVTLYAFVGSLRRKMRQPRSRLVENLAPVERPENKVVLRYKFHEKRPE